jgi:hypothetical protein
METNNLSSQSSANLNEAAKWANVLAIIGFVFLGLSLLANLWIMSWGFNGVMLISSVISLTLGFIPYYYMFKFASDIKNSNTDGGISNLKSYFKFVAILTLVAIGLGLLGGLVIMSMM